MTRVQAVLGNAPPAVEDRLLVGDILRDLPVSSVEIKGDPVDE
jgi:hypothetical protein